MSDNTYELVYLNGDKAGESVLIEASELTVGRSRSNTIMLQDPLVSRVHLKVSVNEDAVTATDMDSSHGTFLNNKRMRGTVSLSPGDILQIGDTKLRFSAPALDSEGETAFVDPQTSHDMESGATRLADASQGGETAFASIDEAPLPDDSIDRTRIIADGETRILDERELKGLKPAATKSRSPASRKLLLLTSVLVVLAIATGAVLLMRDDAGDVGGDQSALANSYAERQFGFSISYPSGWKRQEGRDGALLALERRSTRSSTPLRVDIYADRSTVHSATGLKAGFTEYKELISSRSAGASVNGKVFGVNKLTTVLYVLSGPTRKGKGIYLLSDDTRYSIECSCAPEDFEAFENSFNAILSSMTLTRPQIFIDFPLPDETIIRHALADPKAVERTARKHMDTGMEFYKNRTVRPENLYLALKTLELGLTTGSALGEQPEFFSETAAAMALAKQALLDSIERQKFQIMAAERIGDREGAYWASMRLMQMVNNDRTTRTYQTAARHMRMNAEKK